MSDPAPKPWYDWVLELMETFFTNQQLGAAGAGPAALKTAITVHANLPTFAPANRQPPPGAAESRDLCDAHPELARRYLLLKAAFQERTGRCLIETCTWRSAAHQQELFKIGRRGVPGELTVTQLDGVTKKSRHMVYPAEAVDVAVDMEPGAAKHHPTWDRAAYAILGPLAAEFGLVWGGNWHLDDYPHLELPANGS